VIGGSEFTANTLQTQLNKLTETKKIIIMRTYKLNGGYSFEYALNKKTDVEVIVTDYNQVTITHYQDNDEFDVIPSAEEKEKWLQKVEDMRTRYSKISQYLNRIDELNNEIIELKKDMISILDAEEDSDLIAAIENGKGTGEIQNILER